ncbi:MAG TPA: hypothetical protein VEQ10_14635 [Vicinamibacteria bacterium]|nr:hypothetical protein [Vicinamibacteria bacterium]
MADGGDPLFAVLRFLLFSLAAVVAPGVALQRLARVRWVPALVLPLGLAWCALAWWLALAAARPLLFPVLTAPALVALWRPGRPAPGPSLRGALPPLALLVALFALTQYGANRVDRQGAFLLDMGEHVDTALHVGVSFELVAGYPPQVPGLAGVTMQYHVGSHLVRAAASRWAAVHPYDAISRFDITLWAIALVLALRAAAQAVGLGQRAVALAGFLPLLCDVSFLPGLLQGARWWAFRLGDNFLEPLFYANSITPALAMAVGCVVSLARAERGEGRGFTVLAAALAVATGFFKVFTGAQLVLALGVALLRKEARLRMLAIVLPAAVALAGLALRSASPAGAAGVSVHLVPFAPLLPALQSFGIATPRGLSFLLAGLLWALLSLGLRLAGVPAAALALHDTRAAGRALSAFALCGWPLAAVFSITADPDCDEAFYLLQASGVLLWLFAVPTLGRLVEGGAQRPAWRRALVALVIAAVTLPSTVEFLVRKATQEPEVLPAAAVEAMAALRRVSCPGDVVITRPLPRAQWVPLPVVLAGRRVAFSNYLGYWRQFVSPAFVSERDRQVRAFFRSTRPEAARQIADALGARFAYLTGAQHVDFDTPALLVPVFERDGERVYRVGAGGGDCGDEDGASGSSTR